MLGEKRAWRKEAWEEILASDGPTDRHAQHLHHGGDTANMARGGGEVHF